MQINVDTAGSQQVNTVIRKGCDTARASVKMRAGAKQPTHTHGPELVENVRRLRQVVEQPPEVLQEISEV